MGTQQPVGVRLFATTPYLAYDGSIQPVWKQIETPEHGSVMQLTGRFQMQDGNFAAFYGPISPHGFMQAIPVSESDQAEWQKKSESLAGQFSYNIAAMVEVVERVSADQLVCRVWQRTNSGEPPRICIGESGWSLATSTWNLLTRDKANGKRAFLTFDGIGYWEVLAVLPPLGPNEPVRVEIVRKRSLTLPGYEGVLEGRHLDFIADSTKRMDVEKAIHQVERDLLSDRARSVIIDGARVADDLILEVGRQYVESGRTFGSTNIQFSKTSKWLEATLNARTGAFFTEFATSEFRADLERFRAPLDSLRHWSNIARHAGSDETVLIEPDAFTSATCYGALRDFVRVLFAIYAKSPKLLRPDPMPVNQAATP